MAEVGTPLGSVADCSAAPAKRDLAIRAAERRFTPMERIWPSGCVDPHEHGFARETQES